MIKKLHILIGMISLTGLLSCGSLQSCPITTGTTKIVFSEYANSGVAISTTFHIVDNSLVWEYEERRNNCHLRDTSHYDTATYQELVASLAAIKFSARDPESPNSGGEGWGYAFYNQKGHYFHFNSESRLTGDYEQAAEAIQHFIRQHEPEGLKRFNALRAAPHPTADFGEFTTLPDSLLPYSVR